MIKTIALLLLLSCLSYAGMMDISPTLLRYGVSDEPFTPSDTVTATKWFHSGNRIYIKTTIGEIWAAWAVPERMIVCDTLK